MPDDQHTRSGRESQSQASIAKPTVGIVVPVYRHTMLVAEAVQSAIGQSLSPALHVVIVDDGCDFPETSEVCRGLAAAHPHQVTYLRQSNRGLSAARNTGIDFLLASFPGIRAIYFLDADNRLRSDAMEGALRLLEQSPGAGWVYPDISMFGVAADFDYGGPYSHLIQRAMNQSEAGSLVHADVFRQGIRFDETMRNGYEDWSFFLTLSEAGWRGEHLDDFGLLYRKRGESMLTDSTRMHAELEQFIRRKHKRAFSLRTLLALEQKEAPRYAVYVADKGEFIFTTDPRIRSQRLNGTEFARRYWEAQIEPNRAFFPPFVVVTTEQALAELDARGLLPFAFWRLEAGLNACAISFLEIDKAASKGVVFSGPLSVEDTGAGHLRSHIAMTRLSMMREIVGDSQSIWSDTLTTPQPSPHAHVFNLRTPPRDTEFPPPAIAHAVGHVFSLLRGSHWRAAVGLKLTERAPGIMPRWFSYDALRRSAGAADAAVFPAVASQKERHVGFLLPLFAFGGVEKAAGEAARTFRARGWIPHLFVGPGTSVRLPDSLAGIFETVTLVGDDVIGSWDDETRYLGTPMPSASRTAHQQPRLVGLLGWLDAVVNCHSAGGHAAAAMLRKAGVVTLCHQHVLDRTADGRPTGHPILGLAYEHAYDFIVCCSESLSRWFVGMGAPPAKVLTAANAPGYPLAAEDVAAIIADRRARSPHEPLRVLFSGRLDRQKGVERLIEAIDHCKWDGVPIAWRVVGDAVLDGESVLQHLHARGVDHHPAAYTSAALTRHYAWADVTLMLSRWEGLPLTLLEAMRVGVATVAVDVGAVAEACVDGVTGRLIDPTGDVSRQAATILAELAADRPALHRLSAQGAAAGVHRTWSAAFGPVIDAVEDRIENQLKAVRTPLRQAAEPAKA